MMTNIRDKQEHPLQPLRPVPIEFGLSSVRAVYVNLKSLGVVWNVIRGDQNPSG